MATAKKSLGRWALVVDTQQTLSNLFLTFDFYALALPANIRLGWKRLPGTNTTAYYEKLYITGKKVL
jgi:hypothetical protein